MGLNTKLDEVAAEAGVCGYCGSPDDAPDPTCPECPDTERVPCQIDNDCAYIATDPDDLTAHHEAEHPDAWECRNCDTLTDGGSACHRCDHDRPEVSTVVLRIEHHRDTDPAEWEWLAILAAGLSRETARFDLLDAVTLMADPRRMEDFRKEVRAFRQEQAQYDAAEADDADVFDGDDWRNDLRDLAEAPMQNLACALWPEDPIEEPACAYTSEEYHSPDRVQVFHGSTTPTVLCGRHATPVYLPGALAYRAELAANAEAHEAYRARAASEF